MVICDCLKYKSTSFSKNHIPSHLFLNAMLRVLLLFYTLKPIIFFSSHIDTTYCPFRRQKPGYLSLEPYEFCCIINIYHYYFNTNNCDLLMCRACFIKSQALCTPSQFPKDLRLFLFGTLLTGFNILHGRTVLS